MLIALRGISPTKTDFLKQALDNGASNNEIKKCIDILVLEGYARTDNQGRVVVV